MAEIPTVAPQPGEELYWKDKESNMAYLYGNPVKFVAYSGDCDIKGRPIITIETRRGKVDVSSVWFQQEERFPRKEVSK